MQHKTPDQSADADVVELVRRTAQPLAHPAQEDQFSASFAKFADARIVLLGEASHGTSEFYEARAAITKRLIEEHGFTIVAIEADWPDASRVDRYVRHKPKGRYDEHVFARFPTWMWRNQEVADFVEWLREHNRAVLADRMTSIRGLDVYSLGSSITEVLDYLDREDPEQALLARRRYGCLTPWHVEPASYGRAVLTGQKDACEDAVVAQLQTLLQRQLEDRDDEDLLDAVQNARVVRSAEQYYRIMYRGSNDSWNLRDRHMFETLQALLDTVGPHAKAVVWAHNSHVGNASATEMGWRGQFNIGELCKTAYSEDAVIIGFGTDSGTVAAADDWDEPMAIKSVRPALAGSYERLFHDTGLSRFLLDLRENVPLRDALSKPRLERAIGVIYRPETERHSHYFDAVLPDQFDAYVWFDQTEAVTPIDADDPHGTPETYPFGL